MTEPQDEPGFSKHVTSEAKHAVAFIGAQSIPLEDVSRSKKRWAAPEDRPPFSIQ